MRSVCERLPKILGFGYVSFSLFLLLLYNFAACKSDTVIANRVDSSTC